MKCTINHMIDTYKEEKEDFGHVWKRYNRTKYIGGRMLLIWYKVWNTFDVYET